MKKNYCAYCNCEFDSSVHKRTKEHIFPHGLIQLFPDQYISFSKDNVFIDNNGIVVNDVCAYCNNIVLSDFDAYGKGLVSTYFCNTLNQGKKNDEWVIPINYILLSKWLLKIIYNYKRQQKIACSWFNEAIPYIINNIRITNIRYSIYLGKHINVSPLPEEFFNYMPLQINRQPKLLRHSVSGSCYGIDPYNNMIVLHQIDDSYALRFGDAVFFVVLWQKNSKESKIREEDTTIINEFDLTKIDGESKEYTIHRITADTNLSCGYTHFLTHSALNEDDLWIKATLGGRSDEEVRNEFLDSEAYEQREKGKALVETAMFPNNKFIDRKYKKIMREEI